MKLWFDTESQKIVNQDELVCEYDSWLKEMEAENGLRYMIENHEDFTFEAFAANCETAWNGTLIPIKNAENYVRRCDT